MVAGVPDNWQFNPGTGRPPDRPASDMTVREAVAAAALQGLLASPVPVVPGGDLVAEAVAYADRLIERLNWRPAP